MPKLPDFRAIAGKFEPKYAWKHFLEGAADSEMSWKHEKIEDKTSFHHLNPRQNGGIWLCHLNFS